MSDRLSLLEIELPDADIEKQHILETLLRMARATYTALRVLLLLYSFVGCKSERNMQDVNAILDEAKKALVPDRRTVVCHLNARLDEGALVLTGEMQNDSLRERVVRYIIERTELKVIDSLVVLPHPSLGGNTHGVVNVSVASIRSKPGHAKELATQALLGTPLRVLKKEDDWWYVQTPDGYLGWMDDGFQLMDESSFDDWAGTSKIIVTANHGNTYHSADSMLDVVGDVVAGCILKFVKNAGACYEVEYPDKRKAFLPKDLAQPYQHWIEQARDTPASIVSTAKRFFGVPYLWGGTSAKAMDCSGFTKTVYFLNGVLLPRDASQQVQVGDTVDTNGGFENLQIGDLLFFGFKATDKQQERVTHVGLYLGNMKFIHESGDVHINSFNKADPDFSEYRYAMFLHAKRIIGASSQSGVKRLAEIPYYRGNEL